MAAGRISEAQLIEIKGRHPCDVVAGGMTTLRRGGKLGQVGACPICAKNKSSKRATEFECNAEGWVCAKCGDGGDVIKLIRKVTGKDFHEAIEYLGGAGEIDAARSVAIEAEAKEKAAQRDRQSALYRERERKAVYDIWKDAKADTGRGDLAKYLERRHLFVPAGCLVRSLARFAYFERIGEPSQNYVIHRGPAMLLPIVAADGKFSGLHATYLDLAQPGGKVALKHPDTGEALPAKKVRGSKTGGRIEIRPVANPHTLIIGEGFETVLSVYQAHVAERRPIDGVAFWAAVDLGNLGGRAIETVPHPTLKTKNNRAQRVPGPVPDLDAPGIPIPESVERIVILGDGDSDRYTTACAIVRASARFAMPTRTVGVAWAPGGQDFNDLAPDWAAILAIVEAPIAAEVPVEAAPPAKPAHSAAEIDGAPPGATARPSLTEDSSERLEVPADASLDAAAPPPARPSTPAEKGASSHNGKSGEKTDLRRGAGRAVTTRRTRGGPVGHAEDPAALDLRLAFFPQTDLGNAERMRERYRGRLLWCEAIGWLCWDGKRWAREGALDRVKRAAHETVRSIQDEAAALADDDRDFLISTKTVGKGDDAKEVQTWLSDRLKMWGRDSESNARLNQLAAQASAYLSIDNARLDADPFKINVGNGTLSVARSDDDQPYVTFSDHDPRDLITKLAPVDYDPDVACPLYDKFLGEVQPKPEMRRFLHQWLGLSLTGDVSEQRLAVWWGKGKNGKSVLMDTVAHVAGDYGATTPIETFLAEGKGRNAGQATPDLAVLPGVRMLRTSEPKRNAPLDEALIKLATGGEEIKARHLNRDYFNFYPQFKLTISGNYRPKITGSDEGIWRRVMLVPWTYTVPEESRDRHLFGKLKAEASGILNRLLEGLCDWLDHGLVEPHDVGQATAEYREDSDPLGRFLDTCVRAAPGQRVQSSALHQLFCAWAKVNAATEWTPHGFTAAMKERGFHTIKASAMFFLDIEAIKVASDFVDGNGHAVTSGRGPDVPPPTEIPDGPRNTDRDTIE